jgi:hypothetical protein
MALLLMDILGSVLAGRPVADSDILDLVARREPEGLYLEYKRGKWLGADKTRGHELREYTSGFANAEGGLLVIGVVGGEDAQGADKWSIEGASCPDKAGWEDWLSRVLQEIAARTRVRSQIVQIESQEVVLVGVDRAEVLIRVYEKPRLICYLRTGSQTIPIEDTLFADLALGRRVKPDLELKVEKVEASSDSIGFGLNVTVTVHNQGLVWVPDLRVALVGYLSGPTPVSESMKRHLDIWPVPPAHESAPVTTSEFGSNAGRGGDGHELRPFEETRFGLRVKRLPASEEKVRWGWAGAVLVLPKNGSPLWAQIAVEGEGHRATGTRCWVPSIGTAPVVAWLWSREASYDIAAIFGPRQSPDKA